MGETGRRDKTKRETQKKPLHTAKEKRRLKHEKKKHILGGGSGEQA
jgi:hypothetical protein